MSNGRKNTKPGSTSTDSAPAMPKALGLHRIRGTWCRAQLGSSEGSSEQFTRELFRASSITHLRLSRLWEQSANCRSPIDRRRARLPGDQLPAKQPATDNPEFPAVGSGSAKVRKINNVISVVSPQSNEFQLIRLWRYLPYGGNPRPNRGPPTLPDARCYANVSFRLRPAAARCPRPSGHRQVSGEGR